MTMGNMKKFKGFNGIKKHEGEVYVFKKGKARIPGCRWKRQPIYITLKEFNELQKEI